MFYQFLSWKSPLRLLSSLGYFSQLIVLQFPPEFPLSPALTESQSYSRMLGMSLCDNNFKLKYSIKTLTSRWVSVVDRIYKMAAFSSRGEKGRVLLVHTFTFTKNYV